MDKLEEFNQFSQYYKYADLMCTECNCHEKRIQYKTTMTVDFLKRENMDDTDMDKFTAMFDNDPFEVMMFCKKCAELTPHVVLDHNIAGIISVLNKNFYTTTFSCEGHITNGGYSTFYIQMPIPIEETPVTKDPRKLFKDIDTDIFMIEKVYLYNDNNGGNVLLLEDMLDKYFPVNDVKRLIEDGIEIPGLMPYAIDIRIDTTKVSLDYAFNKEYLDVIKKYLLDKGLEDPDGELVFGRDRDETSE